MKDFKSFINERSSDNIIDLNRIECRKEDGDGGYCKGITFWYNPKNDERIKEITGLKYPDPPDSEHSTEGNITFNGKKIGFASNFNGLMIQDFEYIEENIDKLDQAIKECDLGLWY